MEFKGNDNEIQKAEMFVRETFKIKDTLQFCIKQSKWKFSVYCRGGIQAEAESPSRI